MYLYGQPVVGNPGESHSTQQNPLGMRCHGTDEAGNFGAEYIYLPEVASAGKGSWVVYDEAHAVILLDTDLVDQGDVAVSTYAATATAGYQWYAIKSAAISGLCLASFAADAIVFATSTGGSVDDADTGVGFVVGALGRTARDTTTGLATFQISYPTLSGADLPN